MSRREYNLYGDGITKPRRQAPIGDYPRLVRSHYDKVEHGEFQHERDVLRELSALAGKKYLGEWRAGKPAKVFFNKLAQAASRYGSPYNPLENTLFAWVALITHVDLYKRALLDLQTTPGGLSSMLEGLERRFDEVAHRIKQKNEPLMPKRAEMTLLHPLFSRFASGGVPLEERDCASPLMRRATPYVKHVLFFCGRDKFHQTVELTFLELLQTVLLAEVAASEVRKAQGVSAQKSLEQNVIDDSRELTSAVRGAVAEMLMNVFRESLVNPPLDTKQRLVPDISGWTVSCPVGVWVEYKLAELWSGNFTLLVCAGCGAVFRPTHGSTLYCGAGGCADAVYYRSEKGREAQARKDQKRQRTPRSGK